MLKQQSMNHESVNLTETSLFLSLDDDKHVFMCAK